MAFRRWIRCNFASLSVWGWSSLLYLWRPNITLWLRSELASLPVMESSGGTGNPQKATPLARELTKIFSSYNKQAGLLRKNLKETNIFFREIRQNYSNACASAANTGTAALEAGKTSKTPVQLFVCSHQLVFFFHHMWNCFCSCKKWHFLRKPGSVLRDNLHVCKGVHQFTSLHPLQSDTPPQNTIWTHVLKLRRHCGLTSPSLHTHME